MVRSRLWGFRRVCAVVVLLLCGVLAPRCVSAQGVMLVLDDGAPVPLPRIIPPIRPPHPRPVPAPPRVSYQLERLEVVARIREQTAAVQVSQTFKNPGPGVIQAQFLFPLPYDGAVDSLTLLIDGKEHPAQLLNAADARARYQSIVRQNKDPALLEWLGTGMFQTSVFPIPAGETRTLTLTYQQLLRQERGLTDFLFPLRTARYTSTPVQQLSMEVSLDSPQDLRNIYSPSHPVQIERPDERRATVRWSGQNTLPEADFRLYFDTGAATVAAKLLSYRPADNGDGYFLLLANPGWKPASTTRPPKTVSLVIDKSGSMTGEKIEQARQAALFVVDQLRPDDLFQIIAYDTHVESFRPELERAEESALTEARAYIQGLRAGGGTNIHAALERTFASLRDRGQPNYVLFLTDGQPTSGETNEARIAAAARQWNSVGARLMTFGVGYDVNSRLLDRLARDHRGASEYVQPKEQIEAAIARVYQRLSSPVLTEVNLVFEGEGDPGTLVNRRYPGGAVDLFDGQQLVIVGRYTRPGAVRLRLSGQQESSTHSEEFTGEFTARSRDRTLAFIEKLWAVRRIGELIDELDLNGRNEELIAELVSLSTTHGVLTPYTAFLADETVLPSLTSRENVTRAGTSLGQLDATSGERAFRQRNVKQMFKNAEQAAPAFGGFGGATDDEMRAVAAPQSRPSVIQVGSQTLYRRGGLLLTPATAAVDLEKDTRLIKITRFSEAYFDLVEANSSDDNEMFSQQGPEDKLLVELRGKLYLIE